MFGTSTNKIKGLNIKSPNLISNFSNYGIFGDYLSDDKEDFTGLVFETNLKYTPYLLATKPYVSYKSSKSGGIYELVCSDTTFKISSNNSVAVASGGIYLIGSSSTDIGLYNPISSPDSLNTTLFENELKKESCYSAVSAYDDTIYLFGNDINSDNYLSGCVQCFNPNTGV